MNMNLTIEWTNDVLSETFNFLCDIQICPYSSSVSDDVTSRDCPCSSSVSNDVTSKMAKGSSINDQSI